MTRERIGNSKTLLPDYAVVANQSYTHPHNSLLIHSAGDELLKITNDGIHRFQAQRRLHVMTELLCSIGMTESENQKYTN
jgi:hypothetical protein